MLPTPSDGLLAARAEASPKSFRLTASVETPDLAAERR